MESPPRRQLLLFDEKNDITYFEMKAWKAVVHTVVAASQLYADKIDQGREILKFFCELRIQRGKKRYNSQSRAERFNQCLTKISEFHKAVLGDMVKHTGPDGPFGDLLMSDNHVFEELLKRAAAMKKTHLKLEKNAAKAWKHYGQRVRKKEDLYTKLSGTMTAEDIELDRKYTSFKSKTDAALTRYNIFFTNEVNEREVLAQKTESLKEDFLEQEKEKLDAMFASISNLVERMEKLTPPSLGCLDYEPEEVDTTSMAGEIWESSLKKHTFPKHRALDDTTSTEDVDDISEEADSDDEDKESVDDDDSDEESENTYFQPRKKEIPVGSLAAPKNDHHLAEVLEEILMSDNDEPAQERSHTPDRVSTPAVADVILPESPRSKREVYSLIRQRSAHTFQSATHEARRHKSAANKKETRYLKMGSDYQPSSSREEKHLKNSPSKNKELSTEHAEHQQTVHAKSQPDQPGLARRRRRAAKVVQSRSQGCDSSSSTAQGHSNDQKSPSVKGSPVHRLDSSKEGWISDSSGTGLCVSTLSRVSVFAVQNWKKTSPNQISLRVGMKIKQIRAAGADGMAYGYKKTKLGMRIHGSYPAGLVSLCVPTRESHPNE
ncbi:uncharacterized protein [Haliotis cracherodii]|uniref:uncharacterized protein n=1 Tax=Haliotis cracherodii TaxID=6455 RepID=UPI0039E7A2F6